jgi:hypothetical protein
MAKAKLEQQGGGDSNADAATTTSDSDITIREMSRLQAHHELMKEIIRNFGPSGRYE